MFAFIFALHLVVAAPLDPTAAEVVADNGNANLLVYDGDGELAASIVVSLGDDGLMMLDADFADGVWVTVDETTGGDMIVQSNDAPASDARLAEIADFVGLDPTMEGWGGCLWSAAGAIGACAAARPIFCVGGAYATACNCLPLIVEEFEDQECPGW